VLGGIEVNGVFVAAQDVDGVAAHPQAGSKDKSLVDGVAHCAVGRAGAFRPHVALGGESGQKVGFGGLLG